MEKRLILTLGTVMCLVLSVGCQGPSGLSEADRTAIRQAVETFVKAVNARDWKAGVAVFAEDAILMPPNQAAAEGTAAILVWLEAFPPHATLGCQVLEVEGRGDLAYARDTCSVTVTPAGAAPIEDRVKLLALWRKQADGSWKCLRDIWNSDLPLPAPEKPAPPAKKKK